MIERVPMTEQEEHTASKDGNAFRAFVGLLALVGSLAGFFLLFFYEMPPRNENAIMLALGIVFGWGSAVVQSEYGASTTGRKVAESAIKKLNENAQDVNVVNPPSDPVPTIAKKDK